MKVSVIAGTRPEAIKMAPVVLALKSDPSITCHLCSTGQHRQMLDRVFQDFEITPDTDLNLMVPNQTLAGFTARAIEALDGYMAAQRPDLILVQGDTTTVFCASLAAFYHKIPVGHVEAGLRTGNFQSPWPEEANRVLTTRLAALHFAPTERSRQNLLREGVPDEQIYLTGNTVTDALLLAVKKLRAAPAPIPGLPEDTLESLNGAPIVLITGHRRENFGQGFENICLAIADLARMFPHAHFIYPVHLNPNVREPVRRILKGTTTVADNIHLLEPLSYLPFVSLMIRATVVLTDSGGVQEEAPSIGKPVLVMRDTTERPEALECGTVRLVGTNRCSIVSSVQELLTNEPLYAKMARATNPYGDGSAAARILVACQAFLSKACSP